MTSVKKYVDDIVTVSDDEVASAILALIEQHKLITEGAGAVSVAAVMFNKVPVKGKKCCLFIIRREYRCYDPFQGNRARSFEIRKVRYTYDTA